MNCSLVFTNHIHRPCMGSNGPRLSHRLLGARRLRRPRSVLQLHGRIGVLRFELKSTKQIPLICFQHRYVDYVLFGVDHFYHGPTCSEVYNCIWYDPEGNSKPFFEGSLVQI